MTTKQYLNQVDRLDKTINNKLAEIYQLKSLACNISVVIDGEKVKSSGSQDRLGDAMAKIIDMERETDEIIDKMVDLKKKIVLQIESLENTNHYEILFARYIKRDSFEDIVKKTHYSRQQVWRIHSEALNEFEKKFGDEYLNHVT